MNQSLQNYKDHDSLFITLVSVYSRNHLGWGFSVFALITIAGIFFIPFLIAAQIFSNRYVKRRIKAGEEEGHRLFKAAGFVVTREIQADDGRFLIDEGSGSFAYWVHGVLNFTPGIAKFEEVTSAGYNTEGDSFRSDPLLANVTHRDRGKTLFTIKFDRLDQPIFKFNVRSSDKADVLMQQFSILAKLD